MAWKKSFATNQLTFKNYVKQIRICEATINWPRKSLRQNKEIPKNYYTAGYLGRHAPLLNRSVEACWKKKQQSLNASAQGTYWWYELLALQKTKISFGNQIISMLPSVHDYLFCAFPLYISIYFTTAALRLAHKSDRSVSCFSWHSQWLIPWFHDPHPSPFSSLS